MTEIVDVHAREILDSRGNPTLECEVTVAPDGAGGDGHLALQGGIAAAVEDLSGVDVDDFGHGAAPNMPAGLRQRRPVRGPALDVLEAASHAEDDMGLLEGKVAIVTGSGGGIGREHALLFAREGARVVVNDLGSDRHGGGKGADMADKVVAEIKGMGGDAVANYDSVATREGADGLVWSALNKFGKLDIVVNNAGILRDKTILNMSEQDFDLVIDVHLRGTFLASELAGDIAGTIVGVQGPKIFLYRMAEASGVAREGGPWSAAEIKERWAEIAR